MADAAIKLGMNVVGYDPHITVDAAWSLPSQVRKAQDIEEVLKGSDYVTLHVPLHRLDTQHGDRRAHPKRMRDGAILLNFARDGLVDDAAVAAALESEAPALLHVRLSGCGAAGPSAR